MKLILDDFPSLTKEAALFVLEMAKQTLCKKNLLQKNSTYRRDC